MGKYCSGLGITSTRLEQTMCSPWEEAAQPRGERREAGAEAVSISEWPARKRVVGAHGGDVGSLAGSESILNPLCSFRGARPFSPAGGAGCGPHPCDARESKERVWKLVLFSLFFFFPIFPSFLPCWQPNAMPSQPQCTSAPCWRLRARMAGSNLPAGTTGGEDRQRTGHVPDPNPNQRCWGGGPTTSPHPYNQQQVFGIPQPPKTPSPAPCPPREAAVLSLPRGPGLFLAALMLNQA